MPPPDAVMGSSLSSPHSVTMSLYSVTSSLRHSETLPPPSLPNFPTRCYHSRHDPARLHHDYDDDHAFGGVVAVLKEADDSPARQAGFFVPQGARCFPGPFPVSFKPLFFRPASVDDVASAVRAVFRWYQRQNAPV